MTVTENETTANGGKAGGGSRPRPTFGANKVTELPQDATLPRNAVRTDPALIEALQVAKADPGEWYEVAVYQSANGAKTMLKRIQKGLAADAKPEEKVNIPEGDWDMEARRVQAPGGDASARWSKLYAKFLG